MACVEVELMLADFFVSFLWVWSSSVLRILAYSLLGIEAHNGVGPLKASLAVVYVALFAWLRKATRGGSYNPLIVLCYGLQQDLAGFLFALLGRIPAQVIGSIVGVRLITAVFPEASYGPRLNVDIHQGTLTEGLLTFMIVVVALGLKMINPKGSSTKTWISSISKVMFHFLGSDLTGGIMNPATAFGWAYVEGNYMTKEHLIVYWLAPIEGTVLGVWTCSLFVQPRSRNSKIRDKTWMLN